MTVKAQTVLKRAAFLEALASHGRIGQALATAALSASALQRAKQSDPVFRAALHVARQIGRTARAAGGTARAAKRLRQILARPHADWNTAIDDAVLELNAKLIRQATNGVIAARPGDESPDGRARIADADDDVAIGDTQLAISLLKAYAGRDSGARQPIAKAGGAHVDTEAFKRRVVDQLASLKRARRQGDDPATAHDA